jgi:hypothetical protein
MEETERIAKNLKGTSVRRLKLTSSRASASSAELQQRTVATSAIASTMADLCRLRIPDGAVGEDDARSDDARTEAIRRVIVEEAESIHNQEQLDGAYLRRRVHYLESDVSRLQETIERLTKECSERPVTRGTSNGGRHAVGNSTMTTSKANSTGAPTGTIMGPATPPSLHSRPASSRFRCSGAAGSNERVVGEGTRKSGGSGRRDRLEDLKALFLRKAEEWWKEMALCDVIPPVTDAAAVSITVRARSRLAKKSSRSTAESSVDEADGLTSVVGKGRRNRPKKRGPEAQPPPTAHAPTDDAKIKGRASASSLLLSRKIKRGFQNKRNYFFF